MHKFLLSFLLVLALAWGSEAGGPDARRAENGSRIAGWGIDACLSVHVEPATLPEWVALLRQSDVRWLRERNVFSGNDFDAGICGRLRFLRGEGFELVAFAGTPASAGPARTGDQLPGDLRAVYEAGVRQAREFAGVVSAWELTGEPDVGYCRDLPDRLAAYNKAMYLGLKSGGAAFQASLREKSKFKGTEARDDSEVGSRTAGSPHRTTSVQPGLSRKFKDSEAWSGVHALPVEAAGRRSELNLQLPSSTHDGRPPIVLMGALALPPGPWWERAVANGLLDYTDGLNFHFYGHAEDLTSVIDAHRDALRASLREKVKLKAMGRPLERAGYQGSRRTGGPEGRRTGRPDDGGPESRRSLPLWLTECGVNAMPLSDFLNVERRAFQAQFTLETTRQALAARDLAMFMPFILVNRNDPHAMATAEPVTALPAWDAYATLTKERPWPERSLSREFKLKDGSQPNPVVVQWMPAEGTVAHKVAGTYRVGDNEAMAGELRVYNFGERAVEGELAGPPTRSSSGKVKMKAEDRMDGKPDGGTSGRAGGAGAVKPRPYMTEGGGRLEFFTAAGLAEQVALSIPAGGVVTVPVIYTPKAGTGYFREQVEAGFREASGRVSSVVFGVERSPAAKDFTAAPVVLRRLRGESRLRAFPVNVEGAAEGPWRVFNGLEAAPQSRPVESVSLRLSPGESDLHLNLKSSTRTMGAWRFSVGKRTGDPLAPTYAIAALEGVPKGAEFLRLTLDRPMSRARGVRVDLVDTDGQRFTIWENLGNVYGESSREVWLALEDFHPYFWSKAVPGNRRLRPDKVREISLRVYLPESGSLDVALEWMTPRSGAAAAR